MWKSISYLSVFGFCLIFLAAGCAVVGMTETTNATVTPTVRVRIVEITATPSHTPVPPTQTPTRAATATLAPTATPFIVPPANGDSVNGDSVAIPILMYHHLQTLPPNASETLRTWTVAPEQFAAQLDYLQARGFHTITFQQLLAFFENGAPLPTQPIILTFDDAWIDGYTVAFPELRQRGMVGVFFVPTRYVNAGGALLMNWEQVLEMDRAGMEFGGHTISHEDLTKANLQEARRQLVESKAELEEKLGHPIAAFSYPFGAYNARIVAETQAAGYQAAVILCCGFKIKSAQLLTLPRIRISYDDTIDDFAKRLP
jgi:peptidoglycan/xylan/chitin deacetylase (PgdA/CDA1 family)